MKFRVTNLPTDKELLDFLDAEGNGIAVIEDDNGHWCVACDGFQEVVFGVNPQNFSTNFMVPGEKFGRKTIREAIAAYMQAGGDAYTDAVNECYEAATKEAKP